MPTLASRPVSTPATYIAMIVRTIVQMASPAPALEIAAGTPKIAKANDSKTVQMAANTKTPPQIALQLVRRPSLSG